MRYIFFTLLAANLLYFVYADFLAGRQTVHSVQSATEPPRPDTIYLLSENGDARNAGNEQLDMVIGNAVRKEADSTGDCLAIGPFDDIFSGQAVVKQLQSLDIAAELRAIDHATGQSDYRVLIPPAASLQDAFRKLRELKSRKIDSYVITQGEYALGISLGVFASQDAADKMRAAREQEGYEAKVAEIPRLTREFWIFSTNGKDLALDPPLWQSIASEHAGLGQNRLPCRGGEGSGGDAG